MNQKGIIVLSGGLDQNNVPNEWTKRRLDLALKKWKGEIIITASRGTFHKPHPLDKNGYPIYEAVSMAQYLLENGIESKFIRTDNTSYDTIGNAYFTRVEHTDVLELRDLLIITSDFHMPRSQAIFEWAFSLEGKLKYHLDFVKVSDEGIDPEIIKARTEKEILSLEKFQKTKKKIGSLAEFNHWLYTEHDAYAISSQKIRKEVPKDLLRSY